jgi:hypothetical protein
VTIPRSDAHEFTGHPIEGMNVPEKARDSMPFSRESSLNEIEESDLQSKKHFEPRVSTLPGMTIDRNKNDENAFLPIPLKGRETSPNACEE